jgi:hypothetical protein
MLIVPRLLHQLAKVPYVSFIDIHNNPLYSVERLNFWRSLQVGDELVGKIIWVDRYILNSAGWKILINDGDVLRKMEDVQRIYYSTR